MKKKYFINANIIDPYNSLNETGGLIIDENGNDISEWKMMPGVSDLTRIERQQYVVTQLINELKSFESIVDLNSFVTALENTFVIDENLSLNKAVEVLWTFRNINLSNVNKFTTLSGVPVNFSLNFSSCVHTPTGQVLE